MIDLIVQAYPASGMPRCGYDAESVLPYVDHLSIGKIGDGDRMHIQVHHPCEDMQPIAITDPPGIRRVCESLGTELLENRRKPAYMVPVTMCQHDHIEILSIEG